MVDEHPNLGIDLPQLAGSLLAFLEPLLEAAATYVTPSDGEPGRCQQAWCPVCAIVAVASGEEHPMVAVVTDHAAGLVSLLRAIATPDLPDPPNGGGPTEPAERPDGPGNYEPIQVTIHR